LITNAAHTTTLHSHLHSYFSSDQVRGDVFVARIFDNDDDFKRLDFTLNDLSSSAPWYVHFLTLKLFKALPSSCSTTISSTNLSAI
jgi:hypothetical protein